MLGMCLEYSRFLSNHTYQLHIEYDNVTYLIYMENHNLAMVELDIIYVFN